MIFEPGTKVEILERGEWVGPFTVMAMTGRTPDHLVLLNPKNGVFFEHYNDAPFNTREA
jgi:glyoxylase-like metal-dependent hydrolase (beta-lactamase superfamily II)